MIITQLMQLSFWANAIGPAAVLIKRTLQTSGLAAAQAQYRALLPKVLQHLPPGVSASSIPSQPPNDPQAFGRMLDREITIAQHAQIALKRMHHAQIALKRMHQAA